MTWTRQLHDTLDTVGNISSFQLLKQTDCYFQFYFDGDAGVDNNEGDADDDNDGVLLMMTATITMLNTIFHNHVNLLTAFMKLPV